MSKRFTTATPEQIERARDEYAEGSDNNIELDGDAKCAPADTGVWVQAWVWLSTDESGGAT